jgi:hypothetical protein
MLPFVLRNSPGLLTRLAAAACQTYGRTALRPALHGEVVDETLHDRNTATAFSERIRELLKVIRRFESVAVVDNGCRDLVIVDLRVHLDVAAGIRMLDGVGQCFTNGEEQGFQIQIPDAVQRGERGDRVADRPSMFGIGWDGQMKSRSLPAQTPLM